MTRDIKSLCCLTKPNKPTIFLHFFINTAKLSVLFQLTVGLILLAKPLSMGLPHSLYGFFGCVLFVCMFVWCVKHKITLIAKCLKCYTSLTRTDDHDVDTFH